MTTAVGIGSGSRFFLADASAALVELAEIISVSPPDPQTADIEATHMLSPNRRKEYIAGLIEDGTGSFEMNLVPGSVTDLLIQAAQTAGTQRNYKIVLPVADGSFWRITGACIVKGYNRNTPIDNRMTATLMVRFTGASVEAAGS